MKKMTCAQMAGPCDAQFQANSADEMMGLGAAHVNEMAAAGDPAHMEAKKMMDEGSVDEAKGKAWYDKFQADFAALPEE